MRYRRVKKRFQTMFMAQDIENTLVSWMMIRNEGTVAALILKK